MEKRKGSDGAFSGTQQRNDTFSMIMLVGDIRVPVAHYRGNNALLSNHFQYQKQPTVCHHWIL
jgi:hypothetical protein